LQDSNTDESKGLAGLPYFVLPSLQDSQQQNMKWQQGSDDTTRGK